MSTPDYAERPEALVAALARTGDRTAFAALVKKRQSWIRDLMRRCCGDPVLADDLAQQTFLQAWRDIAKLREPEKFGAWLKRIAINVWRQHARKNDPLFASDELTADTGAASGKGARPGLARDLDHALQSLSGVVRLCIVLNYHEGMTHAEVAALTGLPLGTVKSHVKRGSEQLRRLLSAYEPQGDTI